MNLLLTRDVYIEGYHDHSSPNLTAEMVINVLANCVGEQMPVFLTVQPPSDFFLHLSILYSIALTCIGGSGSIKRTAINNGTWAESEVASIIQATG